ncbi:hypothetical protein TW86_03985 [Halomonas sp. S2151]|uniref:hypothetical protein n=1 Tax=Halomonas sp. S2151 TaxID=579478 RepID=UPI0005F9B134|nr:hypothetical protein [Halomonas sp. S2151]KJZ17421.1 hypothetical protein TW86_03985 [Halomonas sp. S2151]
MNLTGVISDLKVMTGSALPSSNALQNMFESSAPPGYDGFRPYIPGYYDFQKAIFRHAVRAKTGTPILSGLEFTADMPDVVDRGQASVEAGQLKQVYFGKRFTVPPEIGHTVIAANEYCTVRLNEINETGFIFHMVNAANEKVAGTISWSATGY